ncbi:MAG TPA: hypothetical protein VFZ27_08915 [Terriglobia bacterium]|nr:hypothetical protein [Terriglobia bacterium]
MKYANSLDTAADRLLSERQKPKPSGWWKWVLVLLLAGLFVYRSTRPVMRLSAEPPPSFYDHNRKWDRREAQHERLLARAYWNVAIQRIQSRYSPMSPLPAEPPPQFEISEAAATLESGMITARVHYWERLREVWSNGDAWVVSYGWNTGWAESTLNSIPQYLPKSVTAVFQSLGDIFNDIANKIAVR